MLFTSLLFNCYMYCIKLLPLLSFHWKKILIWKLFRMFHQIFVDFITKKSKQTFISRLLVDWFSYYLISNVWLVPCLCIHFVSWRPSWPCDLCWKIILYARRLYRISGTYSNVLFLCSVQLLFLFGVFLRLIIHYKVLASNNYRNPERKL